MYLSPLKLKKAPGVGEEGAADFVGQVPPRRGKFWQQYKKEPEQGCERNAPRAAEGANGEEEQTDDVLQWPENGKGSYIGGVE